VRVAYKIEEEKGRERDVGTKRLRDEETERRRDKGTNRLRDIETVRLGD
jgi:hypothetical protein